MARSETRQRLTTSPGAARVALAAALTLGLAAAVSAQGRGMATPVYGVTSPGFHHVHEGPLGDAWLKIEEKLRCNCGCGEDVHHCQFRMECGTSPGWSERILVSLQAGQTPEQIQAGFVADFGQVVLMAPPVEGFNLLGYFLPGVTILMAGALIGLVVRGGMGRAKLAPVAQLDPADEERLRVAMKKLDESESPDW
jgi:cytochrome c-type biogenesis protein CcmH/NrfF